MRRLIFGLAILWSLTIHAQTEIKGEHSALRVFALQSQILDGDEVDLALDFKLDPEWHIYWQNPGDSGASPKVNAVGAEIRSWAWPAPERIPIPPLTNYGYNERVLFPLKVKPAAGAREIVLELEWLVCKVECIPVFGTIRWPLNVGTARAEMAADHPDRRFWNEFAARVPAASGGPTFTVVRANESEIVYRVTGIEGAREIFVFPNTPQIFTTRAPQVTAADGGFEIALPFATNRDAGLERTKLTVVLQDGTASRAYETEVSLRSPPPALARILLFAFLGGLILNLMPCVFPVLALKVFSIVREPDRAAVRRSGWQYTAGVLLSFLALGGGLMILRAGGEALGWGFQLQSPGFVLAMLILFVLMALNFAGLFELGTGVMNFAGRFAGGTGSFGTGVLAVFVASPCTAPFMGSALGATLLLPVPAALSVFLTLGLGLAFPVLLFGEVPALGRRLPRAGAWMETFKQFMAFPMLATAAWLLWVLQFQTGPNFMLQVLFALILITFAIWWAGRAPRTGVKLAATIVALGALVWVGAGVRTARPVSAESSATDAWAKYSAQAVTEAKGKTPVFVDFTASWCITCQVNKLNVLNTDSIQQLFHTHNVKLLKADWTDRDPEITKALAAFGRNSVPLYVYYSTSGEVKVLPEILTHDMINELFAP